MSAWRPTFSASRAHVHNQQRQDACCHPPYKLTRRGFCHQQKFPCFPVCPCTRCLMVGTQQQHPHHGTLHLCVSPAALRMMRKTSAHAEVTCRNLAGHLHMSLGQMACLQLNHSMDPAVLRRRVMRGSCRASPYKTCPQPRTAPCSGISMKAPLPIAACFPSWLQILRGGLHIAAHLYNLWTCTENLKDRRPHAEDLFCTTWLPVKRGLAVQLQVACLAASGILPFGYNIRESLSGRECARHLPTAVVAHRK